MPEGLIESLRSEIDALRRRVADFEQAAELGRDMFEHTPRPGWVFDAETLRFLEVNAATSLMYGYTREEFLQMTIHDIRPAEEVARLTRLMASTEAPVGASGPWKHRRKDGSELLVEVNYHAFVFNGRQAWLVFATDITGKLRTERELEEKNKELAKALEAAREATELKSRFLANMSHEIRTPMNGVIGMINLLLDTPLNAEQRDYAETVRLSADNLLTIINDILDLSAIEAGKISIEISDFDPRVVIEETVKLLRERAASKGISIAACTDPALPSCLGGDPVRIRQVLLNLVSNAVKFTDQGSINVRATRVRDSAERVEVRFEVGDTGIGIARDELSRIFESFVQVDPSPTRRHGGTGLGLAISKQLVEMMGGKMQVESELEQGSTFSFTLELLRC
jgi:PAS domain S-box-containing protein